MEDEVVAEKKPRKMKTVAADDGAEVVAAVEGAPQAPKPEESVTVAIVEKVVAKDEFAHLSPSTRAEMEAGRAALARLK